MIRRSFIELVRRQIYGGQPTDDSTITVGLVNGWLNQAIGVAARANYIETGKLDGIACVNNSFYTSFINLQVLPDSQFIWVIELPEIPVGIGSNEGISMVQFNDNASLQISQNVLFLSQSQWSYFQNMRPIPNKILALPQGKFVYVKSTLILSQYSANVTMVSGGDSTDLDSELNVPADYHPIMIEYLKKQLMFERQVPVDVTNDGSDVTTTT